MKTHCHLPAINETTMPSLGNILPGTSPQKKRSKRERVLPPNPRILFVTPEISHVGPEMCSGAEYIRAKAGGMADVSATLVAQLQNQGADVHLAIPHYRNLFNGDHTDSPVVHHCNKESSRVHLAEDSAFYGQVSAYHGDLRGAALAFQREVINHIIPLVKPDIVHCNDWMTAFIPAACKKLGIRTIFTIHNIHRERTTLAEIEYRGIDVSDFWEKLHYEGYPYSFDQSYHHNAIDPLASAIINADHVTTVSPTFLREITAGRHGDLPEWVKDDLRTKMEAGYARGILNSPDPSYDPGTDPAITQNYRAANHQNAKSFNKVVLQKELGLTGDYQAPLLFWPSRLDPIQKGCQLLTEILYAIMRDYENDNLQLVVVGDGPFQSHFREIVVRHGLEHRIAIADFDETLSRRAFASSDYVLMPSSFEPCGLPQMIGARYGCLSIVHNTGGLHDTIDHCNGDGTEGNGFVFNNYDSNGLRWAIDRAMDFHHLPVTTKEAAISRVMIEARTRFDKDRMFRSYSQAYAKLAKDRALTLSQPGIESF